MRHLIYSLLLLLIAPASSIAQRENNIWYFGYHAGIDFNSGAPVALADGETATLEGTASIAHWRTGELLFYTDGDTIWDARHQPMPNGQDLIGGMRTSAQSALIIPFPQDTNKYFVFTSDQGGYMLGENRGVFYSVVDMSRRGGRGDVIRKNVRVFAPPMTEKITAIPHTNGCDLWVISHEFESRRYAAILVRDSAVVGPVVYSAVGTTPQDFQPHAAIGYLVGSKDGTRLAYADASGPVEVSDFDRTTGKVTNARRLMNAPSSPYGVCFSPSGEVLYVTSARPNELSQYDLTGSTTQEIIASRTVLNSEGFEGGPIRPGPDGKLYVAQTYDTLGVINMPDERGTACQYNFRGVILPPGSGSAISLPNVIDYYVGRNMRPCLVKREITIAAASTEPICQGDCIHIEVQGAEGLSVEWIAPTATPTTSTNPSTMFCFDTPGDHVVTVAAINGTDTLWSGTVVSVKPRIDDLALRSISDTAIAIGDQLESPIVLNKRTSLRSFSAEIVYDTSMMEYLGSFLADGSPLDVGIVVNSGHSQISYTAPINQTPIDSIIGVARFNVFWTGAHASRVAFRNVQFDVGPSVCLTAVDSMESSIYLDEACGAWTIARAMRSSLVKLFISPNPASSEIRVRSSTTMRSATLRITDALGRLVHESTADLSVERDHLIPGLDLPAGNYRLEAHSAGISAHAMFLVRR